MRVRLLTRMLAAKRGSTVVIVEHVGGKRPLDVVSICIFENFLFGLFLFLLLGS